MLLGNLILSGRTVKRKLESNSNFIPADKNICDSHYIFVSTLEGNHSNSRVQNAFSWYLHGTLASIIQAISEHQQKHASTQNDCFTILLLKDGSYRRCHTTNLHLPLKTRLLLQTGVYPNYQNFVMDDIFVSHESRLLYFIRIDADDLIMVDFLVQLTTASQGSDLSKQIVTLGPTRLDRLDIDGTQSLRCKRSTLNNGGRLGYHFSLGQTVLMTYGNWMKYFPRQVTFGGHSVVNAYLEQLAPEISIISVDMNSTGLYMVTRLSGHFQQNRGDIPLCNLTDLLEYFGRDKCSEILKSLPWLPDLDQKAMQENLFWSKVNSSIVGSP